MVTKIGESCGIPWFRKRWASGRFRKGTERWTVCSWLPICRTVRVEPRGTITTYICSLYKHSIAYLLRNFFIAHNEKVGRAPHSILHIFAFPSCYLNRPITSWLHNSNFVSYLKITFFLSMMFIKHNYSPHHI